jgi:ribosomal protein S18 acetylase RimI-like enzyme
MVHEDRGRVSAVGAAVVLRDGDSVVEGNTGHFTTLAVAPGATTALSSVVQALTHDLIDAGVTRVTAGNAMLDSGQHSPATGILSSTRHGEICGALEAAHFETASTSLVLSRPTASLAPVFPANAVIEAATTAAGREASHNNLGYRLLVDDAFVGWCGTFNTHAFNPSAAPELYIHWLMVVAQSRRRGHAKSLLRHAISEGHRLGLDRVTLSTRAENYEAQALYRNLGFRLEDVAIEFTYRGPRLVDAIQVGNMDLRPYFNDDRTLTAAASLGTFGGKASRQADREGAILATALSEAAKTDNAAMIWRLLDYGVPVDATTADGSTALHAAAWAGSYAAAGTLLSAGADARLHDSTHEATASEWAEYAGHEDLAELLAQSAEEGSDSRA